ncbi:Leucine-rich repeat protein soc-2-like protein [Smittium culicis]|uniref:Leucine-rich repeat protein soc-2-like protein n=1 Tax=Smittium culicis TaxID=133412 RepID=A0A1R1YMP5_9FUNG|nr:Leucine-rich repeat protein soc-2-like protein [Smittium culicis]
MLPIKSHSFSVSSCSSSSSTPDSSSSNSLNFPTITPPSSLSRSSKNTTTPLLKRFNSLNSQSSSLPLPFPNNLSLITPPSASRNVQISSFPNLKRPTKQTLDFKPAKISRKKLFFDDKSDDFDSLSKSDSFKLPEFLLQDVQDIISSSIEDGKSDIDLSEFGLKVLPKQISELKHIVSFSNSGHFSEKIKLYLNSNKLPTIPDSLLKLSNLTVLILSNNRIDSIPPDIKSLYNLNELSITGNKISVLPSELFAIPTLNRLFLFPNPLIEFPKESSHINCSQDPRLLSNNSLLQNSSIKSINFPNLYHLLFFDSPSDFTPPCILKFYNKVPSLLDIASRSIHKKFYNPPYPPSPSSGSFSQNCFNSRYQIPKKFSHLTTYLSCNLKSTCAICSGPFLTPSATVFVWCLTSWFPNKRIPVSFNFCSSKCIQSTSWFNLLHSLK